jgi:hypothetical protein
VPRGLEAGNPHAAISPRRQVPAHIILRGYPLSRDVTEGFDIPALGVDGGAAWGGWWGLWSLYDTLERALERSAVSLSSPLARVQAKGSPGEGVTRRITVITALPVV